MTLHESLHDTLAVNMSGISERDPVATTLASREQVFLNTQAAADAVMHPADCGAWPPALRAALAARIARHHELPEMAARFQSDCEGDDVAALADPCNTGSALGLAHVVVFVDTVATVPRSATAADISDLKAQHVSDADIVRLTSLVAFLAYQVRLVSGLRLLADSSS